jgi:hypothetical protein
MVMETVKTTTYTVIQPPTSAGVERRARAAIASENNNLLSMTVLPKQEVPRPMPEDLTMRIIRPTFNIDNHHLNRIEGYPTPFDTARAVASVILNLDADPNKPATVTVLSVDL